MWLLFGGGGGLPGLRGSPSSKRLCTYRGRNSCPQGRVPHPITMLVSQNIFGFYLPVSMVPMVASVCVYRGGGGDAKLGGIYT